MKEQDVTVLRQVFLKDEQRKQRINSFQEQRLQEQVHRIMDNYIVKKNDNRSRYMKYFNVDEEPDNDENDMGVLMDQLKELLDFKLKSMRIQFGQHLVDPTVEELKQVDTKRRPKKLAQAQSENEFKLPLLEKPIYESSLLRDTEEVIESQKSQVRQLRDRFQLKNKFLFN